MRWSSVSGVNRAVAGAAAVVVVLVAGLGTGAEAQESPAGDPTQELADRYAPIVMVKAQDGPCDETGEPYGPASVEIVLDNPDVVLRQLGPDDPVVQLAPGAADLFGRGEGFHLEFPGSALDPGCIYETDYRRYTEDHPPTVYAHVVQQQGVDDQLAVQYWIYWYYNDWNNKHESDWEMVQVLFDASTVEEALATDPASVGYAQHEGGERADWEASKLQREGSRPVVFSSAGSHASYYSSALYLGRRGSEGFGCDNTDGPSDRIDPEVVVLPDAVDDADDPLAWLAFEGRWGERQSGPFNGPTGPAAKDRWLEPVDWHDDLRSSSVIIPGGDSIASEVVHGFCGLVEWGSGTLIQFTTSPARVIISLLLIGVVARWLIRRTDWSRVAATPLIRRRRAGQLLRAAIGVYRGSAAALLVFGLVFLPAAILVGLLGQLVSVVPVINDLLGLAGRSSGTSLALAVLIGSLPTIAAYTAVSAMAADHLQRLTDGEDPAAAHSLRAAWDRRRPLVGGFVRAFAIVYVLLVTIIGIPWAIRQLVRYQLVPQAVMLDGCDGKGALARSSELVAGRWWHTALLVSLFNGVVALSGMVFGLLLLVIVSGLPMWLFSGLVTLIYALVVPLASVALGLLYGDAVAEREGATEEAMTPV